MKKMSDFFPRGLAAFLSPLLPRSTSSHMHFPFHMESKTRFPLSWKAERKGISPFFCFFPAISLFSFFLEISVQDHPSIFPSLPCGAFFFSPAVLRERALKASNVLYEGVWALSQTARHPSSPCGQDRHSSFFLQGNQTLSFRAPPPLFDAPGRAFFFSPCESVAHFPFCALQGFLSIKAPPTAQTLLFLSARWFSMAKRIVFFSQDLPLTEEDGLPGESRRPVGPPLKNCASF